MDRLFVVEVDGRFEFSHEGIEEVKAVLGFTGYFISDRGRVFCTLGKGHRRGRKVLQPISHSRTEHQNPLPSFLCEGGFNKR